MSNGLIREIMKLREGSFPALMGHLQPVPYDEDDSWGTAEAPCYHQSIYQPCPGSPVVASR